MDPMLGGSALLLALLCAAAIGLAIQRGGTCTVDAVHELLSTRRPTRLLALLEAALWVGCGLLLARELGLMPEVPAGHPLTRWTFAGAALLGIGAVVNGACAFGAVARLGAGQWAYAATPVGFYAGCLIADRFFAPPPVPSLTGASPALGAPSWLAWTLVACAVLRLAWAVRRHDVSALGAWSPHAATTVIGISFVGTVLLAGGWAYTDVLADLARGMADSLPARLLLAAALLLGALAGGRMTGRWRPVPIAPVAVLRCLAGGALMAWGSLLIPGGNDGLVLLGLPLLWPYAWAAFATMVVAIAAALTFARRPALAAGT